MTVKGVGGGFFNQGLNIISFLLLSFLSYPICHGTGALSAHILVKVKGSHAPRAPSRDRGTEGEGTG